MNSESSSRVRLDSWKAIAGHLGRSVRTVQRWELEERLPVHRLQLQQRGAVFAYLDELDAWWQSRSKRLDVQPAEVQDTSIGLPASSKRIWFAAGLIALMLAVFTVTRTAANRQETGQQLPVPLTTYAQDESAASFSPDGSEFAFVWNPTPGNADIYVKPVHGATTRRLTTHPSHDYAPKWSPDGKTIAFWRRLPWEGSELILVSPQGGPERSLGEFHGPVNSNLKVPPPYHSWVDSQHLILGVAAAGGGPFRLRMLSITDGKQTTLFDPPAGVLGDAGPAISPDGKRLVFHRFVGQGTSQLFLASLKAGNLVDGTPRAITFDLKFNQNPVWISNREIVFFGYRFGEFHLLRMSVDEPGRVSPLGAVATGMDPAYSTATRRLAYTENSNHDDLWRIPLAGPGQTAGPAVEFVSSSRQEAVPIYSPDGRSISFTSTRAGYPNVWICDVASPDRCRQMTNFESSLTGPGSWSPDGRRMAFGSNQAGKGEIYTLDVSEGSRPRNITNNSTDELFPTWSRDGRWIYFASDRSGRFEVWKSTPDGASPSQVSSGGGYFSAESYDGRWLYFTRDNNSVTSLSRQKTAGGAPAEKVVDKMRRWFALGRGGVYYLPEAGKQIWYWDGVRGESHRVAETPHWVRWGLAVSSDERELCVTQSSLRGRDIMMIEYFR